MLFLCSGKISKSIQIFFNTKKHQLQPNEQWYKIRKEEGKNDCKRFVTSLP